MSVQDLRSVDVVLDTFTALTFDSCFLAMFSGYAVKLARIFSPSCYSLFLLLFRLNREDCFSLSMSYFFLLSYS